MLTVGRGWVAAGCAIFTTETITLPNAEEVDKIVLGTLTITNKNDINTIITAFAGATRVNNSAMNDQPFTQNMLNIYIFRIENGEEIMWFRFYLYTENGNELLWNSYEGVYKINPEDANKLREFYIDRRCKNGNVSFVSNKYFCWANLFIIRVCRAKRKSKIFIRNLHHDECKRTKKMER